MRSKVSNFWELCVNNIFIMHQIPFIVWPSNIDHACLLKGLIYATGVAGSAMHLAEVKKVELAAKATVLHFKTCTWGCVCLHLCW